MSHYFRKLLTICANLLDADTKGKEARVPHHRGFLIIEVEITHEIWHLWKTELSVKRSYTENQTFVRLVYQNVWWRVWFSRQKEGSLNQTCHRPKKCLTFTSPVVWRKHVTQRTRTPEWSEQVYTEMGANTWVSSTFINIWIRNITEML